MLAHALLHRFHARLHGGQPSARGARAGSWWRLQQGREAQEQHRAHAAAIKKGQGWFKEVRRSMGVQGAGGVAVSGAHQAFMCVLLAHRSSFT